MDAGYSFKLMTYEIDANISCCYGCQNKMEQKLKLVKGVESVALRPEENKVVVVGNADPDALIKEVRKIKKCAIVASVKEHILLERKSAATVGDDGGGTETSETESERSNEKETEAYKIESVEPQDTGSNVFAAMKKLSSSALGKVASGLKVAADYLGHGTDYGDRITSSRLSFDKVPGNAISRSEQVGLAINVMGVGGKLNYRKDLSY